VFPAERNKLTGMSLIDINQGCGAGTQISGSGTEHLNFLAPAPTSRSFWLRQNNFLRLQKQFAPNKSEKNIVLFVLLARPTNHLCGSGAQISGFGSTI